MNVSRYYATARIIACITICLTPAANADSPTRTAAKFASGPGVVIYLGAGALLPLVTDKPFGKNHAIRVIDSLGASIALSEALQDVVREKRPNSNAHDSFPSDHASAAFAVATAQTVLHPKEAPLWYAGATLIGLSRLRLNEHHPDDVIAGAALGYGITKWEFSEKHGLILQPWIHNDTPGVMIQRSY